MSLKEWVTVAEAAVLVGRHVSAIYRWVDDGRFRTRDIRTSTDGVTELRSAAVVELEPLVRRGRPRGSATIRRHAA